MDGESRTLTLQLEDDKTVVVTRSEEVEGWMRCQDPEAVALSAESLNGGALAHVPDTNGLVLASEMMSS